MKRAFSFPLGGIFIFVLGAFLVGQQPPSEIHAAARDGDLEKVRQLVEKDGALVKAKDLDGRTPLHWACRGVHLEVLKFLVDKGAEVNAQDRNGVAPLHSLATRSHLEGMAFLLARKAEANIKTANNDTPLHFAASTGNVSAIMLLLDNGADPSARNARGDAPLDLAAGGGFREAVDILLDRGADMEMPEGKALSLFQASARNGMARLFKAVADKEGKRAFADRENSRWVMLDAICGGSVEVVKILLAHHVPLDMKADLYGWTPLHYAASQGRPAMVEFLLEKGVEVNARTKAGETAYNLAWGVGNTDVQGLIIKAGGTTDPQIFPQLRGPYLGQKTPGMTPEVFAPGVISRPDTREYSCVLAPDGAEVYFYRQFGNAPSKIFGCRMVDGAWTAPEEQAFSAAYSAFLPFVSFDNRWLYFNWIGHPGLPGDVAVFVSERKPEGWSEPKYAGQGMFVSQSRDGRLYITDLLSKSDKGMTCLAEVTFEDGVFRQYKPLPFSGPDINRAHPCISPDGSYIIYDQGEGDHLLLSFKKKDGTWGEGIDLTKNGFEPLAGIPSVSPDGKYLFFKQGCRGSLDMAHSSTNRDVWWVDARVIERLRPLE